MINYSIFGERLAQGSGIEELMEDLGKALAEGGESVMMLGGGQPAKIDELSNLWKRRLLEILEEDAGVDSLVGIYDPPSGQPRFLSAMVKMFRENFGWNISEENLAVTGGGQSAFFFLFNALAGVNRNGVSKKILLPLVPEYIGYANQSVGEDMFTAVRPKIEKIGSHRFKYRVDFDAIEITNEIAAICVSRPTNPSGNVLTDEEVQRLSALAKQHEIPLIIDNAYGAPFPNIFFADAEPWWDEHVILTLSFSKIGLPGTRTGVVIAHPEVASGVSSMVAISGLSNGNIGQRIMGPLVETGEVLKLSNDVVKPFYQKKSLQALHWVDQYFDDDLPYRVHLSEGALFLWMHFDGMPISSRELYQRLKKRGVLVVSGDYFFFGLSEEWRHSKECIRVTYTMADNIVEKGLEIIAEEVARAYGEVKVD